MKRLSSDFKWIKYILIGIVIFMLIPLFHFIKLAIKGQVFIESLIVLLSLIIGFCALIYSISRLRIIHFDSDFLYIKYGKNELKVPLENITKLKMIMVEFNLTNFYKIEFQIENGQIDCIRFLPTKDFEGFKKILKMKTSGLKIHNWSHSFDFDI